MFAEIRRVSEFIAACTALVWFLTSVDAHVFLQVKGRDEGFLTVFAGVRPFS
jgi:hypothetical protein